MTKNTRVRSRVWSLLLVFGLTLLTAACSGSFDEDFDSLGTWGSGDTADATAKVLHGVYELHVKAEEGIFWSTAGKKIGDGVYKVEATQVEGTLDNGYGMMFMIDNETEDFYLFQVSGDGFIWIGLCRSACKDGEILIGEGWIEADVVQPGLDNTNVLRVDVQDGDLEFYVNEQSVGQAHDETLSKGDIGVMVETRGEGGVRVHFDNFAFTPADSEDKARGVRVALIALVAAIAAGGVVVLLGRRARDKARYDEDEEYKDPIIP